MVQIFPSHYKAVKIVNVPSHDEIHEINIQISVLFGTPEHK